MLAAPIPDNETERLQALRSGFCAYAPREERFDRITRTAKRLLDVPIALISIVEQDEQWFRSVQGLEVDHTPRDISFCGHAIALNKPLVIPDALYDVNFHDNPLVLGPPGIRSSMGWPLEIASGLAVGSLCVIDTMPRTFSVDECDALRDLASMAEAELRLTALTGLQNKLLVRLSALQRKSSLDALTGCWNIRGFRELLALGVDEARRTGDDLAVCSLRIHDLDEVAAAASLTNRDALTLILAQVLRQRLPQFGALARLGAVDFCALVPVQQASDIEAELARLCEPTATINVPGSSIRLEVSLSARVSWLSELGPLATADRLWASALLTRAT
jgi:GAF domain-containing protein